MKYLGIDYGRKRIGIALSDESGTLAFPKIVLDNNPNLIQVLRNICQAEEISEIILGESVDEKGKFNQIMGQISEFREKLESEIEIPIRMEKEFFTSFEARRYQEGGTDAQAAALILQRYLDKKKSND